MPKKLFIFFRLWRIVVNSKKSCVFIFCFIVLAANGLKAQSVGGTTSGAASFCGVSNDGFISLSGNVGSILNWQYSVNNGISWSDISNTLSFQGYSSLTQSTCYRAVVKDGMTPADTSTISCITVYQPTQPGNISGAGTYCVGSGTLSLTGYTGNILDWEYSVNNGNTWVPVTNLTPSLTYSITQSRQYRAIVQNTSYCLKDTTPVASVVISPSVGGTISGGGFFCDSTGNITFSLNASIGTVLGWQSSENGGNTWNTLPVATHTLSYSNINQYLKIRALVQLAGCSVDTSLTDSVIIKSTIAGSIINNDTTIEYNQSGEALILTGYTGDVVQWISTTNEGASWVALPHVLPSYTYPNLTQTTWFAAVIKNDYCPADTSNIIKVTVLPKNIAFITTLFTPNGDGINDTWFLKGIENYQNSEVVIYNIYGQEVFSQKAYKNDWRGTFNGADLPDGTYYYVIKLNDPNQLIKGSVDIIRGK